VECVWRDGQAFMFDETFIDSAESATDVNRIILFCDVERPMKFSFMTQPTRWLRKSTRTRRVWNGIFATGDGRAKTLSLRRGRKSETTKRENWPEKRPFS
jgi:aspartyl/asparaginyl beta-hydroxylase (cupin superfamily)